LDSLEYPADGFLGKLFAPSLFVSYQFVYGVDWEPIKLTGEGSSIEAGLTQIAQRKSGTQPLYIYNFPLDITFRSSNPYGWPKICVAVYKNNGRITVIKGYGWVHVPVAPGRYETVVPLFSPRHSSLARSIFSKFSAPEFIDETFVCQDEGRSVTRVKSEGYVKIKWSVTMKNIQSQGFEFSDLEGIVKDKKYYTLYDAPLQEQNK